MGVRGSGFRVLGIWGLRSLGFRFGVSGLGRFKEFGDRGSRDWGSDV